MFRQSQLKIIDVLSANKKYLNKRLSKEIWKEIYPQPNKKDLKSQGEPKKKIKKE